MRHHERVQEEFTRQGESFRDSQALGAVEITTRIASALGAGHGRVLDVACGPGILFPTLSSCARTVVGIDLTARSLQLAREAETTGARFLVRGLSEVLPFRSGSFDGAVLRLALHHFLEPAAALASARSVLRPGGRLVVLDLLAPENPGDRALRDAVERFRDPSHTSLVSRSEMHGLIQQAGFSLPGETLWNQRREFREWARIIHEPRRMNDLELVLAELSKSPGDPAGLGLSTEGDELWFTYHWGLFVATA
ncbi:MAG: class I SAM-dependent methyltransferase [Myxococcota bacterium]